MTDKYYEVLEKGEGVFMNMWGLSEESPNTSQLKKASIILKWEVTDQNLYNLKILRSEILFSILVI